MLVGNGGIEISLSNVSQNVASSRGGGISLSVSTGYTALLINSIFYYNYYSFSLERNKV